MRYIVQHATNTCEHADCGDHAHWCDDAGVYDPNDRLIRISEIERVLAQDDVELFI